MSAPKSDIGVRRRHDRYGSKAAVAAGLPDVSCLPDSGGIADIPQPRLGANMRHGMSQRQPTEARERKPLWLNVPPLLARCVFFLKTAFEYLSRVFSRERVPKFDNSRDLKVCELLCEELLHLSCSQRCLAVRLHCSNE